MRENRIVVLLLEPLTWPLYDIVKSIFELRDYNRTEDLNLWYTHGALVEHSHKEIYFALFFDRVRCTDRS